MEREGEEDQDKDGWTYSRSIPAEPPSATGDETPEIGRGGEELPRLSPGVGYDTTAQDKASSLHNCIADYGNGASNEGNDELSLTRITARFSES